MRFRTTIILLLAIMLMGCNPNADCSRPALTDVAQQMAICLSANASSDNAQAFLSEWRYEGEVIAANLLPNNPAPELILTYRGSPQPYDPQGQIAILERMNNGWHVIFESPDPQTDSNENGRISLAGNWWFELDQVVDLQESGVESVLFQQNWSNMMSTFLSYTKLLTIDNDHVQILLVEGDFDDHKPTYFVNGSHIYSQSNFGNGTAITRTLVLDNETFVQTAETINPAAAELLVTSTDGTQFVSFDSECGWICYHQYGLYRIHDGKQFHYDTPIFIHSLKLLPDGHVYIGGMDIWRVAGDELQPIANDFAPLPDNQLWPIVDMEMTSNGEIWAAGQFRLLHFGHEQSQIYDLITHSITIAPDDSVWALGWDGITDSGCCVFHVQDGIVTTYLRRDELPVSPDLATQIFADK